MTFDPRDTPVLASFVSLLLAASPLAQDTLAETYVIRGATVVSPERDGALECAAVVVAGGRIAWVGDALELPSEWNSAEVVDAAGHFVVPGFIDSHVHVGHAPFFSDEHYESRPGLARAYFEQLPRTYLFFGFTTLIDLDLKERSRARFEAAARAPRLYGATRGIRLFEGYGPSLMPPATRYRIFPVWTYEEHQVGDLPTGTDREAHAPEMLVERAANDGALLIKTYHEPGFGGAFDWPVPSPALLRGIVTAAHDRGLPVALHATGLASYRAGLSAGVDVLAHGLWHWPGPRLVSEPTDEVRATIRAAAAAATAIQPTARVILGESDTFDWSLLAHPRFADAVSPDVMAWLETDEGRWSQRELAALYERLLPDPSREPSDYLEAMNARVRGMLALYRETGAHVIFGSDTPAAEGVGNTPGLNGQLEMLAWEQAGFTPLEVLRALTLDNARAFGLEGELGSVEVGKLADLLLLERDPTEGVDAFDSIDIVIVGGERYARSDLSARTR